METKLQSKLRYFEQVGKTQVVRNLCKSAADEISKLQEENELLRKQIESAPIALMDTRDFLGLCAIKEEDFPALYALQGKRVRLVLEGE